MGTPASNGEVLRKFAGLILVRNLLRRSLRARRETEALAARSKEVHGLALAPTFASRAVLRAGAPRCGCGFVDGTRCRHHHRAHCRAARSRRSERRRARGASQRGGRVSPDRAVILRAQRGRWQALAHARPLASAQRSVTPEELARGVAVDVVDVGEAANDSAVIVAWLERGSADLDFDARRARPSRDAYIGVAAAHREEARVVLSKSA